MKKYNKYLIIILISLLLGSYYEIKNDLRYGSLIRDIIFKPLIKDNYDELYTLINKELKKENEDLKNLLNIKSSSLDYELIHASVIERNTTYWLDEITIDKGKSSGIEKNEIVITKNGMIGKIINVSGNTSKVKLITGISSPIPVEINNVVKVLFSDNYNLYIKGINKEDNIKKGDKVVTLGLTYNYPKGILIGEITDIKLSSNEVGYIAYVKTSDNLNNLRFVSVLKRI